MVGNRERFASWLSAGAADPEIRGGALRGLAAAYLGGRVLGQVGRAGAIPIRAARTGIDSAAERRRRGVRRAAEERLDRHADASLGARLRADRAVLATHEEERAELARIERALEPADRARLAGRPSPLPAEEERALRDARRGAKEGMAARAPRVEEARAGVRRAADARAREGRDFTDQDRAAERERLRRLDAGRRQGAPSAAEVEAAGLSPEGYQAAPPAQRSRVEEAVRAAQRERDALFAAAPEDPGARPRTRPALRALGRRPVEEGIAREGARLRAERAERRRRARLFRTPRG
jgi:hypothetical protein